MAERTERTFFGKYWINKDAVFRTSHSSTWTIIKKLSEKPMQMLPEHAQGPYSWGASYILALFLAETSQSRK